MKQRCVIEFLRAEKILTPWHSLILAECLWSPHSGYEHSEAVSGAFPQWWQWCERQATFRVTLQGCQLTKARVPWSAHQCKPSTLTATSRRWLSWRPEFSESSQRRRQPFSCNMITQALIAAWRPGNTLQSSARLSYHTNRIVWIWHLLTSICLGQWNMDNTGNIFLTVTPSLQLWESGSPALVHILWMQHAGSYSSLVKCIASDLFFFYFIHTPCNPDTGQNLRM
jgi:hypothetical protein